MLNKKCWIFQLQEKQPVSLTLSDPLQLFDQRRLLPLREVCLFVDPSSPLTPPPCLRLQASRTSSKHSEERAKWPCGWSQHKHAVWRENGTISLQVCTSDFLMQFKKYAWVPCELSLNNKLNLNKEKNCEITDSEKNVWGMNDMGCLIRDCMKIIWVGKGTKL